MPIHKMQFQDGVFTAKSVGYLDNIDARMWLNALKTHAENSPVPVVALLDVLEVSRICPTVTPLFTATLNHPNIQTVVLAVGDAISAQKARIIDQLSQVSGVHVASSLDDARQMSKPARPAVAAAGVAGYSVMTFASSGAWAY